MSDTVQPGDMFIWKQRDHVCIVVKPIVLDDEDGPLWQLFTIDLNRYENEMDKILLDTRYYTRVA